ncbi:anthrone oxygenase family protein [Actinoplanes sp. NPDC026623]|uniref:anthrone oxygenase family protein n=1 Tax=Actinoplanes sp. NPDC026623 TaxID=3155610 RepID=UPI0034070BB4
MTETVRTPLLITAIVAAGLQAGTYYVWACGVMPGLARVDDHTFVTTLDQVNQSIVNPVFMLTFLGAPILAAAAAIAGPPAARPWLIAGLALTVATVAVTVVGNVPLNDALSRAASTTDTDVAAARAAFETAWVRWNVLRTLTSTAALAALGWAALRA